MSVNNSPVSLNTATTHTTPAFQGLQQSASTLSCAPGCSCCSDSVRFGQKADASEGEQAPKAPNAASKFFEAVKAHFGDKKLLYPVKLLTLIFVLPKLLLNAFKHADAPAESE